MLSEKPDMKRTKVKPTPLGRSAPDAGGELSRDEHRLRHVELHKALDELLADWLFHVATARPSTSTVMELMQWSHKQTIDPDK
jgi:hypothetical protein